MSNTTALERYNNAMKRGDIDTCIAIEETYGLFGYTPELVSVGLRAIESDIDPHEAVHEYVSVQRQDLNSNDNKEGLK
jgi:hypothetical protein